MILHLIINKKHISLLISALLPVSDTQLGLYDWNGTMAAIRSSTCCVWCTNSYNYWSLDRAMGRQWHSCCSMVTVYWAKRVLQHFASSTSSFSFVRVVVGRHWYQSIVCLEFPMSSPHHWVRMSISHRFWVISMAYFTTQVSAPRLLAHRCKQLQAIMHSTGYCHGPVLSVIVCCL